MTRRRFKRRRAVRGTPFVGRPRYTTRAQRELKARLVDLILWTLKSERSPWACGD